MHMVKEKMWNRLANCFARMESWRLFLPERFALLLGSLTVGLLLALRCAAQLVAGPCLALLKSPAAPSPYSRASLGLPSRWGILEFGIPRLIICGWLGLGCFCPNQESKGKDCAEGGIPELTLNLRLLLKAAGARNNWRNE